MALVAGLVAATADTAIAAEDSDPGTGNVTITKFDDRYADGLFDTTKTAPSGDKDRLGEGTINLIDVNGTRHYSSGTNGVFAFENVPVGPATAYITYPNGPGSEVLFDATGATSAADVTRLVPGDYMGAAGKLPIAVDTDGEARLVGLSALRLVANVRYADGTPVSDAKVELGSDDWYPATEYGFRAGTYEAFQSSNYVIHVPGEMRVRVTAPEGYRVASVTAGDNSAFKVTEKDGVYSFSSARIWNFFRNPAFTVTLANDITAPELTVPASGSVKVGETFDALAGVTASDGIDGDLTSDVTVEGSVDTSKTGTTTLTYSVGDAAGNKATATRTVTVVEGGLTAATPSISGTPQVGSRLTATSGTWTPGTTLAYVWAIDGVPVAGATASTFDLAPSTAGRAVTVTVTGSKSGYTTAQRTSPAVTVAKGALTSSKPRITGSAKVGRHLTVKVGHWSPRPFFRYTWYANGKLVKTTSSASTTVSKKWAGKRLTVKVTGTRPGYTPTSVTSSSTSKVKKK